MSFMPTRNERLVPGQGPDNAKIVIVGDYTTHFDDKALRPFSGPDGSVLEQCMHAAGLIRGEVYITNTFKSVSTERVPKMRNFDFFNEKSRKFTEKGLRHVEMLHEELKHRSPNVIVTMGLPALRAVSSLSTHSKYRGYVCLADKLSPERKLIPTHSPAQCIRGNYTNRHMIVCDLKKARVESAFPEIRRPERNIITNFDTVEEVLAWLEYFEKQPVIGSDIEVINHEISCISFAASASTAIVVHLGPTDKKPQGWAEDEELLIWRAIQRVLGNPKSTKIFQNGIFDIQFLKSRCFIEVRGPVHDTMIGHHVMFPELPKGLAFLGSIYCGAQEYWKDAVKFDNIKEES